MELVGAISSVLGIIVEALHAGRDLFDLVDSICEAPEVVQDLSRNALALYKTILSLQASLESSDIRSFLEEAPGVAIQV